MLRIICSSHSSLHASHSELGEKESVSVSALLIWQYFKPQDSQSTWSKWSLVQLCILQHYSYGQSGRGEGIQCVWYTVIREIFVGKNFLYSSKCTKIKCTKYFQHAYYVIEYELNYYKVRKVFAQTFYTQIFLNTKISPTTV